MVLQLPAVSSCQQPSGSILRFTCGIYGYLPFQFPDLSLKDLINDRVMTIQLVYRPVFTIPAFSWRIDPVFILDSFVKAWGEPICLLRWRVPRRAFQTQ